MYFNNRIEKYFKLKSIYFIDSVLLRIIFLVILIFQVNMFKYYENEDETHKLILSNRDSSLPIDRPHSVNRMNSIDENDSQNTEIAMKTVESNGNDEEKIGGDHDEDDDEAPLNPFKIPSKKAKIILWAIFFPVNVLFFFTVPDTRRKIFSKFPFYFLTFFLSTAYLGVLTYLLVWMVVIIGNIHL